MCDNVALFAGMNAEEMVVDIFDWHTLLYDGILYTTLAYSKVYWHTQTAWAHTLHRLLIVLIATMDIIHKAR